MEEYEKLGSFYLGKVYDLDAQKAKDDLLLYDSKDLTTHAVCVGYMAGSGADLRRQRFLQPPGLLVIDQAQAVHQAGWVCRLVHLFME